MAIDAGYVASQNKRWEEANKTNNTDLINRLQADSKRIGYDLKPVNPTPSIGSTNTKTNPVSVPESRTDDVMGLIRDLSMQLGGNSYSPGGSFSYNAETDPAYKAVMESTRKNIAQEQANTNARLRSTGQGKSSWSETVANNISTGAIENVQTNVLPQLISQAYQRYADQQARSLSAYQTNQSNLQNQIANLGSLYGMYNEQDFQNPLSEAQVTGNYLSGEARQYISAINNLKAQAETAGITAAQRNELSKQADAYRAALTGLGIDSSKFGANVNLNTSLGNVSGIGTPTLAKQEMTFNQQFSQDRAAVQDDQWQQEFAQRVKQDGIDNAIRWANNSISQGHLALAQQEEARRVAEAQTGGKPANYNYKNDPDFASNIATINKADSMTINRLLTDINNNPAEYISQYGYSGYEELQKLMNERQKALDSTSSNPNDPFRFILNR